MSAAEATVTYAPFRSGELCLYIGHFRHLHTAGFSSYADLVGHIALEFLFQRAVKEGRLRQVAPLASLGQV